MNIKKIKRTIVELATKTVAGIGHAKKMFLTVHTRPMYAKSIAYRGKENATDASCAIVIQGPVKTKYNFTLETIKLYLQHYPSATLIFSTWEHEPLDAFEALAAVNTNLTIVRSPKPPFPGSGNINMQIASTLAGIRQAKKLGLRYVLKTRTDQRMYGIRNIEFLVNLLFLFPLSPVKNQEQRIIGFNITTTTRYTPYHLSDLWMFGTTNDMETYWNVPFDTEPMPDPRRPYVESRLFKHFLTSTGWELKKTMDDFLDALGKRCIIVGNESIDLYWPKYYERFREYRIRDYQYPTHEISFKEWFSKALQIPAKTTHDA